MATNWIPLQSVPRAGSVLRLDDQTIWAGPIQEFGMVCRIVEPLHAEVSILPQEDGVLFRGKISGKVALPCDRCSEESVVAVRHSFDGFEPLPAFDAQDSDSDAESAEVDETVIRLAPHGGGVEVNPAALVWEEFSLALPVNILCRDDCKGLCPVCGNNRNNDPCACAREEGDPRLSALRGLTVSKKK